MVSIRAWVFIVFCILLGFSSSCNEKQKPTTVQREAFNEKEIPHSIQSVLQDLRKDSSFRNYFDTLHIFYTLRQFKPVWYKQFSDSLFLDALIKTSDSLVYEGLKPEHYLLDSVIHFLKLAKKQYPPEVYQTVAKADIYLCNFMCGVWHDKVLGRTDPREVLGMKYTLPYPNHPEFRLFAVLDQDSGLYRLMHYRPAHPEFMKLRKLLLDAFAKTEGSETLIDTNGIRKLVAGDTSLIVPQLAQRLVELGLAPDTLIPQYAGTLIYTSELSNYIKEFQRISNLTDDGIIGTSTLKILNTSRNDKIDEIRANIERVKWFGLEPPKPYVKVNIPEFMLYMYYPDSVKSLLVCIGKGKERHYDQKLKKYVISNRYFDKPMNHETPQIYSNISYVILNPTWTVPSSIVGREMYNQIVRDPGYLKKNNYQVLKDGKEINPFTINWRKLKPGNIPYTIRQNSGDDNSLGRVKFTFRNPFDVYLHDTPLKSKFKLNNRAVSHGCVRVQTPFELTGFVLQENSRTTYDDVLIMMGMPPTDTARARKWANDTTSYKKIVKGTHPVRVENRMTVFFDYKTIVFDEFDKPRFLFDVYDKNYLIVEAMNRP